MNAPQTILSNIFSVEVTAVTTLDELPTPPMPVNEYNIFTWHTLEENTYYTSCIVARDYAEQHGDWDNFFFYSGKVITIEARYFGL